ncbi:MAG: response regulator [Rhodothermales bacterium]|nr:response regulator [Rhodothermales bacterium]
MPHQAISRSVRANLKLDVIRIPSRSAAIGRVVLLLVAVLLGGTPTASAQVGHTPLDPDQAITQLVHDVWRIEDGLPQNSVRAIEQTRDGYLWLGTEEGLARYNGIGFTTFDKRTVPAFRESQSIRALLEDSHGTLWIGTMGGGLVRYHDGVFEVVGPETGFLGNVVGAFAEGADGEIYVGTSDQGLFVFRDEVFTRVPLGGQGSPVFVRALAHDRYGAIWVGTRDGLFRINHGRETSFRTEDGLTDNLVMALVEDEDGSLWVGTATGLCHYKDGKFTEFDPSSDRLKHPAQTIIQDRTGLVWIGLDGEGLLRVRGVHASFFDMQDGLSHNRVLSLFEDREGSIWIGTEGGGLNRLRKGKFTTYSEQEGLSLDMALAVYADSQGDVWVGTEGGGLNRLRDGKITVFGIKDGLSSDIVTSIYGGDEGELWVGTFRSGLNRFYANSFRTFTTKDGLPGNGISALHRGSTGKLWIATDAGLAVYEDNTFRALTIADGLSSDIVMSVLEGTDGDVWVGTYDAGLNIIRGAEIRHMNQADGLGSNTVLALHEDVDGVMWIGTYGGGLSRVRAGVVQTVNSEGGLFNDNVYQILEDDNGNLWMSCNKGIFYVKKSELERFFDGEISAVTSTSFDRSDGLKSYELNGGFQPAGWRAADGHLWFPSVRGVVSIDPSSLEANMITPSIVIEELRIDGEAMALSSAVRIGPGRHKVEFDYVGLSFVNSDNLNYRIQLEGYESDWNEVERRRTATYTNLDPGQYTFRVMVADEVGGWGTADASVQFRIDPAFYQNAWFWILCSTGAIVLAFSLYMFRIKSLKTRQRELEEEVNRRTGDLTKAKDQLEEQAIAIGELYRFKAQFFNNISHELRTPLTLLLGPLENSLTGAYGRMNGLLRGQLEIMLRNGRRLLRLINQLLDLAKIESGKMELRAGPGDLTSFVEGIVMSFTAFAVERDVAINFTCDDEFDTIYFDPEKLEKVLFNLLSNAVKFTPSNGRIDVSVCRSSLEEGMVEIAVGDTGPGIPPEEVESIFDRYRQVDGSVSNVQEGTGIGLSLARELVELHGGSIRVESVVGAGAIFTVSLLEGSDHLTPDNIEIHRDDSEVPYASHAAMVEMVAAFANDESAHPDPPLQFPVNENAPCILIVDDNRDVRQYVVGCLHPDYLVVQARNGEEALERVEDSLPALILSDVMMPVMDGHELVRRLKKHEAWSQIPIVMLTAKASETSKIEGLEMGVDDYISKPFNARELRARIGNLLRIHEQERELRAHNDNLERRVQEHINRILGERRRYEQELITARDKAEASARMQSTILDNISHELRTPLSTILGYAQILGKELDAEHRDFANLIESGGRRLLGTLGTIIDLSQLESGSVVLDPTEFSIRAMVEETVAEYSEAAKEKGIAIECDYPENHPSVFLDRPKTQRILDHLVNNAVKFTEEGTVGIKLVERGSNISITVTDTGIGIGGQFLRRLFTPFAQESGGTSRSYEGSGLGLAVANGLTELMYGRIDVRSEKGKGSRFMITLPMRLPKRDEFAADRDPAISAHQSRETTTGERTGSANRETTL